MSGGLDEGTLEGRIRVATEALRAFGHEVFGVTAEAVVDADRDGDGRLDANPDTGAGSEPGFAEITVDGVRFTEAEFRGEPSASAIVGYVRRVLAARKRARP